VPGRLRLLVSAAVSSCRLADGVTCRSPGGQGLARITCQTTGQHALTSCWPGQSGPHRVAAQRAERHASSEYAARIEREAVAEPESGRQAEARDGAEMEL